MKWFKFFVIASVVIAGLSVLASIALGYCVALGMGQPYENLLGLHVCMAMGFGFVGLVPLEEL